MLSTDKQTDKQTDRQTDRQTNQRYQKHNLLCQGGNKIKTPRTSIKYLLKDKLDILLYLTQCGKYEYLFVNIEICKHGHCVISLYLVLLEINLLHNRYFTVIMMFDIHFYLQFKPYSMRMKH